MSADETNDSKLRQTMLDYVDQTLSDNPDIPDQLRQSTLRQFEQAMVEAQDNPKSPDEVLADWQQTTDEMQSQLDVMQRNNQISATDAAEMLQPYDKIMRDLKDAIAADPAGGGRG